MPWRDESREKCRAGLTARSENGPVLIVDAVLETPDTLDFPVWPVADLPPYQFMALSGSMSPLEVGSALAMLADYNSRPAEDGRPLVDAGEAIRRLLETDKVIAPGGLRFHDTRTNVTVRPGCCCGLEDWREWLDVADGATLWLGHDPSPRLEHADEVVRLWPDSADARRNPGSPSKSCRESYRGFCVPCRRDCRAFSSSPGSGPLATFRLSPRTWRSNSTKAWPSVGAATAPRGSGRAPCPHVRPLL